MRELDERKHEADPAAPATHAPAAPGKGTQVGNAHPHSNAQGDHASSGLPTGKRMHKPIQAPPAISVEAPLLYGDEAKSGDNKSADNKHADKQAESTKADKQNAQESKEAHAEEKKDKNEAKAE